MIFTIPFFGGYHFREYDWVVVFSIIFGGEFCTNQFFVGEGFDPIFDVHIFQRGWLVENHQLVWRQSLEILDNFFEVEEFDISRKHGFRLRGRCSWRKMVFGFRVFGLANLRFLCFTHMASRSSGICLGWERLKWSTYLTNGLGYFYRYLGSWVTLPRWQEAFGLEEVSRWNNRILVR